MMTEKRNIKVLKSRVINLFKILSLFFRREGLKSDMKKKSWTQI
jgi:hypothetical protein